MDRAALPWTARCMSRPHTSDANILMQSWWTLAGVQVLDVMSAVQQLMREGRVVHIGTDAQKSSRRMEFVTVVCVLNPGKGGRVFYTRRFERKEMTLFDKLSTETWLSLELALCMNSEFDLPADRKQIWAHVLLTTPALALAPTPTAAPAR